MGYRTMVISTRCKLDYKMGYMELRAEETKRVLLSDIEMLIIENPAVSFTGILLEKLVEEKVKVIFCDSKRNPQSELIPYYGNHESSRKIKMQSDWDELIKGTVWTRIVKEKIQKQSELLSEIGRDTESNMLKNYIEQIEFRDCTNREGHSAKVYFNALFGMNFTRNDDNVINAALNYGYSLILSAINREIVVHGYLTQLGLFHDNVFNPFNLSCDLMEPFRIIVDRYVYHANFSEFGTNEKHELLKILQIKVEINDTCQYLSNAIKIYVQSVFDALNEGDISKILFYKI